MCPHCRAFISSDDKICPYCSERTGPRAAETLAHPGQWTPFTSLTILTLIINAAFFFVSVYMSTGPGGFVNVDERVLVLMGAKFRPEILYGGQWWRLITAGFLHGGAGHIFMNGFAIYYVGQHVEEFLGHARFITLYIVATFTGFLFSLIASPESLSIGASAALTGFLGGLIAASLLPGSRLAPARKLYGQMAAGVILVGFLATWTNWSHVDNASHVGGFVGGFLYILVAGMPGPSRSTREVFWKSVAGVSVAITLVCFFKMVVFFSALYHSQAFR